MDRLDRFCNCCLCLLSVEENVSTLLGVDLSVLASRKERSYSFLLLPQVVSCGHVGPLGPRGVLTGKEPKTVLSACEC